MVCCGIVGRGACIQSLLFSVLLVLVFPFLSSREFSGPTSHSVHILKDIVCEMSQGCLKISIQFDVHGFFKDFTYRWQYSNGL